METADRAARNGDKAEGENLAGKDRACAVDEACERRHQNLRPDKQDAHSKRKNGASLDKRAEIVARREKQPNRQGRRREAVRNNVKGERDTAKREHAGPSGGIGHPLPRNNHKKHQSHAHDRSFEHAAGPDKAKIEPQQQRDGDGHRQCEGGPRRGLEGVHHDEADDGKKNRHDRQHGQLRDKAAAFADFFASHLAQRFSVAANRTKKNNEIMYATRERRAGNQPERARQVAELRGERGSDERAGSRDGGKMVAEENPFVRGHEVAAVVVALARSGARVVERENFGGDKSGIEPVRHQVTTHRGNNEPSRIERLAAIESDLAKRSCAKQRDPKPNDDNEDALHLAGFAAVLDLMNCAISALSLASEGAWTYIIWPAS